MAYNLQIAERANDQIDKLTGYLINRLHNRDAAIHFLNGLDAVYRRLKILHKVSRRLIIN